jgi:pimeloyl-ACP methyl ester carboxylesterase
VRRVSTRRERDGPYSRMDHRRDVRIRVLIGSFVLALLTGLLGISPATVLADSAVTCTTYAWPVTLSSGATYRISGELCSTAAERTNGQTVQVLVHGLTYNHTYWDFGYANSQYSYAKHLASNGYATFAYDRLGDGDSSRPPSQFVTLDSGAEVAHQVVLALRSGNFEGIKFGKVIEVGHSFGSMILWKQVSTYQDDVDGLVITGAMHTYNPDFAPAAMQDLHNASDDPQFSGFNLDTGYMTTVVPTPTVPTARGALFYNVGDNVDPKVIRYDESHKDTLTVPELMAAQTDALNTDLTLSIKVPVLLIEGAKDLLFCSVTQPTRWTLDCSSSDALLKRERGAYSPQACLHAVSVPDSGHDISLHKNNAIHETESLQWSDTHIGRTIASSPPGCP